MNTVQFKPFRIALLAIAAMVLSRRGSAADGSISGRVTDLEGQPVGGAELRLTGARDAKSIDATSDAAGKFAFPAVPEGNYEISADAPGLSEVKQTLHAPAREIVVDLQFSRVAPHVESVTVRADAPEMDVQSPDPGLKIFAADDLMQANPARPGAPVSIPGYPVETASSGIKAPQYFAPGVAGDHGEPIAQYLLVGSYLLPNNLSANAHGNGYADPNWYVSNAIESVEVDGGAFNVREGNHALNLATTYTLRSHLDPFLTLTGDQRDIAGAAGFSPSDRSWVAAEASYGDGFLSRPEHRKQFKLNGGQVFLAGNHTVTLFGAGYYGFSYVAGLTPIYGFNSVDAANGWKQYSDTIDSRQKDQTHTAVISANDVWKLSDTQELQLSGFFRTYNLSLFSDFGDGLIRQSEFRTVSGGSAVYTKRFSKKLTLLAGTDYQRDAPRRDDLDRYNFFNPANPGFYGPFTKIDGSNVTISPVSPYIAAEGALARYFHYYLGWRRDEVFLSNRDLVTPGNSSSTLTGVNSPKATIAFLPKNSWYVPEIALSFGKSFFTEDPRIGAAVQATATGAPHMVEPVERAKSYQLVIDKRIHDTELRVTLGRETQTAEYGKIDPDTGLQFDLGPGRVRYLAATLRRGFHFGSLEATFEQADARTTNTGQIIPEAPRLIGDFSWTYQKLPFHLAAKGEFEYVGRKVTGNGCNENAPTDLASYCFGVPVREFRFALSRTFLEGKVTAGLNLMLARGYSGQTTENFALDYKPGYAPPSSVPENPIAEVVGVRIPSYASVSLTYRF